MTQKADRQFISISFSPFLYEGLTDLAKQRGVPRTKLIRDILMDYLSR